MDIHRARGHEAVSSPDFIQQPVAIENVARVRGEMEQELELEGAQLHCPAANRDLLSSRIEPDASNLDDLPALRHPLLPAHYRLDSRYKFPRAEGLDHVVVAANFQSQDSIYFLALGGEEDYRQRPQAIVGAKTPANIEAVIVRQENIQKDDVSGVSAKKVQPLDSSPETLDLKPFFAKVIAN
jgi:hypothetical protein